MHIYTDYVENIPHIKTTNCWENEVLDVRGRVDKIKFRTNINSGGRYTSNVQAGHEITSRTVHTHL